MEVTEFFTQGFKQALDKNYLPKRTVDDRRQSAKLLRKASRATLMFGKRNLPRNMSPFTPFKKAETKTPQPPKSNKKEKSDRLKKWKANKERLKRLQNKQSKPIFKVHHVENKIGLPDLTLVYSEIKGQPIKPVHSSFSIPSRYKVPNSMVKPKVEASTSSAIKPISSKTINNNKGKNPVNVASAKIDSGIKKMVTRSSAKPPLNTPKVPQKVINSSTKSTNKNIKTNKKPATVQKDENVKKTTLKKENPATNVKKEIDQIEENNLESNNKKSVGWGVTPPNTEQSGKQYKKTPRATKKQTPLNPAIKNEDNLIFYEDEEVTLKTPIKTRKSSADLSKSTPRRSIRLSRSRSGSCALCPASPETPITYVSPFVTISRGKESARKEFSARKSAGGLLKNEPATSPKAGAYYFEGVLDGEIRRIEEMCQKWEEYQSENEVTEEISSMIDVAINQSKLLISSKFQQFRSLLDQCKTNKFDYKRITCEDLHGFWDMVYHQVENLNQRFANLDRLKANNWEEVKSEKKVAKKKGKGRPKKPAAKSMIRDLINEARKKQKQNLQLDQICEKTPVVLIENLTTPNKSILKSRSKSTGRKSVKGVNFADQKRSTVSKELFSIENKENDSRRMNTNRKSENVLISTPLHLRRSTRLNPC